MTMSRFYRAAPAAPMRETSRCGHLTALQVLEQDLSEGDHREPGQLGGAMEQPKRHRLPNVPFCQLDTPKPLCARKYAI
jgi:hypothetical protein